MRIPYNYHYLSPYPTDLDPSSDPSSLPGPGTYLNPGLAESQSLTEFLSHEGVRVVSLVEEPLQL